MWKNQILPRKWKKQKKIKNFVWKFEKKKKKRNNNKNKENGTKKNKFLWKRSDINIAENKILNRNAEQKSFCLFLKLAKKNKQKKLMKN